MFLATTALSDFWDKDREILFLGPWCLRYDHRADWEELKFEVMPSPWEDQERYNEACCYLGECYERMLVRLTDYLNAVHGVSQGTRYWRILIGPWLEHFLHPMYDRYVHLLDALSGGRGLHTTLLSPECYKVPKDTRECVNLIRNDPYNLQLCSQILELLGYTFPRQSFGGDWQAYVHDHPDAGVIANGKAVVRKLRRWGLRLASAALSGRVCAALCDMHMRRTNLWTIVWKTKFKALPLELEALESGLDPIFDDRRAGLGSLPALDPFERIFVGSLPQNLPTLFLEGYHRSSRVARECGSHIPAVIISADGWSYNEPLKFVSAEFVNRGTKLVTFQHGGGYGILKHFPVEEHEARISDRYYVWGWAGNASQGLRNLPNPKLSSLVLGRSNQADANSRQRSSILLVCTTHPQYLFRFHSAPVGHHWDVYLEWQRRFIEALSQEAGQHLLVRLHAVDHGREVRQRLRSCFRSLRFDNAPSYHNSLKAARLVVVDHPLTSFLESLRFGIPTILFWNPRRWEARGQAEPYLESLRQAGILFDLPEAAAAKVMEVYDQPWRWWGSEAIQEVRHAFVDRYALGRKDWVDHWVKALEEEVRGSQTPSN